MQEKDPKAILKYGRVEITPSVYENLYSTPQQSAAIIWKPYRILFVQA